MKLANEREVINFPADQRCTSPMPHHDVNFNYEPARGGERSQ